MHADEGYVEEYSEPPMWFGRTLDPTKALDCVLTRTSRYYVSDDSTSRTAGGVHLEFADTR